MRFTLKDHGFSYKVIVQGHKNVGRVFKHAESGYVGLIRLAGRSVPITSHAATETRAFDEVAAKALGFNSPEELDEANRAVKAKKRAIKQRGQALANEYLNATTLDEKFAVFDKIFQK